MTKEQPATRTNPQDRRLRLVLQDEVMFQDVLKKDKIGNFSYFCEGFGERLPKDWLFYSSDNNVSFFKVKCDTNPKITVSFKVMSDFKVLMWHLNIALEQKRFTWLLGSKNTCDLWSKFDCLLSLLGGYDELSVSNEEKLIQCRKMLNEIIENDESDDALYTNSKVLWFCVKQLAMVSKGKPRYSCDFFLWACNLYFSNPSMYTFLRDSRVIIIPHPDYLRKLNLSHAKSTYTEREHSHELFLREIFSSLRSEENMVNLLLDEMHVQKSLSYKAGKIIGASVNSNEAATSVQVFMISSLLSKHKHVAAIYPVNNLTANTLLELTYQVLSFLHDIGYKVVSLISDNNRINRNMFEKMCGGKLVSSIPHPYDPSEQLFFLFDSVHLLKWIRNNWLNKKKIQFKPF